MKEKQTLFDITIAILNGMRAVLEEVFPDLVLVHGDTSTALAAFYLNIPVGHVEAGLRTYDVCSPFPEESTGRTGLKEGRLMPEGHPLKFMCHISCQEP